jgi:hypothetical protein
VAGRDRLLLSRARDRSFGEPSVAGREREREEKETETNMTYNVARVKNT